MPRVLSLSGGWSLVLDAACADAAALIFSSRLCTRFLICHGIGIRLARWLRCIRYSRARELDEWEGAGIDGFSRVLENLRSHLAGHILTL